MEIGKATAIFKNIDQVAASDAEKIEAINEVVALDTHNGITKTDVLHALNWAMKYCLFLECQNFSLNSVRDFQKNDIDRLERRLKHLLQSDFIRSFDEVDVYTKEYKRDIREADDKNTTGGSGKWEIQYYDNTPRFFICSNCKCRLTYRYNFCPCCGSDNRG